MPSAAELIDRERAFQRAIREQERCRNWLANHRGEPGTVGAELGVSDWVKEELLILMSTEKRYEDLIESRRILSAACGFDPTQKLNDMLFPFQADVVRWALRKGRCALFEDCGLGKTPQQLEWGKHVVDYTGKPVIIFVPLAVAKQTEREGKKFGIEVNVCRSQSSVKLGINVTNYEMLEHFDPGGFGGIVLDESSCLKGHDRITRMRLTEFAAEVPFRLSCTATPAPNDFMELGTQSEFLGVMKRSEMLAMFFIHDGSDTSKWRLKGHGAVKFWEWLASWSVSMRSPEDLGYERDGFLLPPLRYHQHTVPAEWTSEHLFPVEAKTLNERRQARRGSLADRVDLCAKMVNESSEQWLVWCDLNDESDALKKSIDGSVEVRGSDSIEHKESAMLGFQDGSIRVLVTKPSIAGWGMNWQNCHNMAFVGLSDSWEQLYQATRRCWRFGQKSPVDIHIITGELEGAVVRNIERKEQQASEMFEKLLEHTKKLNTEEVRGTTRERSIYSREAVNGKNWTIHLGDCVDVAREISSDSIDYQIFSPPFASLYTYSNSERDMGNARNYEEFFEQYGFLVQEQFRICQPGRLVSIHCMDLPIMKEREGHIGIRDFPGDLIRAYVSAGFIYHSRVVIWKDPLLEATRTKAIGLMHKQIVKDSAICRTGLPDYVITVRKPGENSKPISHKPAGFDSYTGEAPEPKERKGSDPMTNKYSHLVWQRYASPVWFDIRQTNTLQYESARENDDERHICPLQLDVIERCMELWSAPGDLVFSPFAGIGSEGWCAIKKGRRFVGVELKRSYWDLACKNLRYAEDVGQADLFG